MRIAPKEVVRKLLIPNHAVGSLPEDIVEEVAANRALLEGHFELLSGDHSPNFLRFNQVGWNKALTARVADLLLKATRIDGSHSQLLCSESSGLFLGDAIAQRTKLPIAITKVDSRRRPVPLMREGAVVKGTPVIIVNDVATRGETLRRLASLAAESGAKVAGILAFAAIQPDRFSGYLRETGTQGTWLFDAGWPMYPAAECPLCAAHQPLVSAVEFT